MGLVPGTLLGPYEIAAPLGAGGMGEVYRAEDPTLKRPVALKRLGARLRDDPHYRHRLLSEAKRASALNCSSIAGIHDVLEEGDQVFLVLEYVEGATLRRRLRDPIPLPEFYRIAQQCLEALAAAHEKGIIHRDIKPENIMLTPAGEVKVLDFGLAYRQVLSDETLDSSQLTSHTPNLAGTPGYIAPEQLLEAEPGPRTDLFSLGIVFFEMLHHRHPFLSRHLVVAPGMILDQPPIPTGPDHVPPALDALVQHMLAKDPDERLASAREALAQLQAIEQGATQPLLPAGITIRLRKRILQVAAAILAVVLVAGVAWKLHQPRVPPQRIRVAVLPFSNQTGNPDLDRFRMTLTQMMVQDLTGSPNVQVLPYERLLELTRGLESSSKDIYQPEAIKAVADFSGSRFVVVPSMFAMGNMLRLSAEFRDVRTGEAVATAKVERALSGSPQETFYSMQDELADRIQGYFKEVGPGQSYEARAPALRPSSVTAAFSYTEGRTALAQGNYARALDLLKRAVEEDPEFALAYARLGKTYAALGYDDKARPLLERASQLIRPETPVVDALVIQAGLAEASYDYSSAEQKYNELLRLRPDDPDAYRGLADVQRLQGRYPLAIATYRQALQLDPNYVVVHQWIGRLYASTTDFPKALEHGEKALNLCRAIGNREGEAETLLNLGEIYRLKGDQREAWDTGQKALRLAQSLGYDSSILAAQKLLGDVLFSQGKLDEALRQYQTVLQSSSELRNNRLQTRTLMNIGVVYGRQGDQARAVEYYEKSLAQGRRYGEYRDWPQLQDRSHTLTNLGGILIEYGPDPDRGAGYVREALALSESMGEVRWQVNNRLNLAMYSLNTGHFQQANQAFGAFEQVLERAQRPPDVQPKYDQARAFFFENRYEQARQAADVALSRARDTNNPNPAAQTQILAGWTYLRLGDPSRARALLEEGLQTTQKNKYGELLPDAYAALGELSLESGDRNRARSFFQQGAALAKGLYVSESAIEARSNLGLLLAEAGDSERGLAECRVALEQARRLQHRHTIARATLNLAQVRLVRHEPGAALEVLNQLLSAKDADLGGEWQARAGFLQAQALANLGRKEQSGAARRRARDAILQLQRELDPAHRQSFSMRRDIRVILEQPALRRAS